MINNKNSALLALASGKLFWGVTIGSLGERVGEIIFNTSMTGYQEILTDPSYAKQMVMLTYPHIGNTGINENDMESTTVWAAGLIIREEPRYMSHHRATLSLSAYLKKNNVMGIAGIDTRYLTHSLRIEGSQTGCLMTGNHIDAEYALYLARRENESPTELIQFVSTKKPYVFSKGAYRVVVYDLGVKKSILKQLAQLNCEVIVVPANTPTLAALAYLPHGIVLSNGPGDPRKYLDMIHIIKELLNQDMPLLGICLGYQLLGLALGANIIKMKFGHHGTNHPVRCYQTQKIFITSQNHQFAIEENSLPAFLKITHRSLFDNTLQGITHLNKAVSGFQGHPEGGPGPNETEKLFDMFIKNIIAKKMKAYA